MNKNYIAIGGIIAALAILSGALGSHWLRSNISMIDLQNFETAVRYQIYHAIAIIILGIIKPAFGERLLRFSFHAFWLGTLLFSGSIYLLSTSSFSGISASWLGPLTPIGGVLFIAGWISLVINALTYSRDE
jgi:uncharacterized membrane protein YgdD (TMEM256/DUF423 family)